MQSYVERIMESTFACVEWREKPSSIPAPKKEFWHSQGWMLLSPADNIGHPDFQLHTRQSLRPLESSFDHKNEPFVLIRSPFSCYFTPNAEKQFLISYRGKRDAINERGKILSMNNDTYSLFSDIEFEAEKGLKGNHLKIVIGRNRSLTKSQQMFNKLTRRIEQLQNTIKRETIKLESLLKFYLTKKTVDRKIQLTPLSSFKNDPLKNYNLLSKSGRGKYKG